MNIQNQAGVIALLRMNLNCTFSYIGGSILAIWGKDTINQFIGKDVTCRGGELGRKLVGRMEEVMEVDSEMFSLGEQVCTECRTLSWGLSPDTDAPKECDCCGGMSVLFMGPKPKEHKL